MQLTANQTEELLNIIQKHTSISIGKNFGLEFLTDQDIERLEAAGIDIDALYSPEADAIFSSFNLGLLSQALGMATNAITFDTLRDYIKGGHYIPLTEREKLVLNNIKRQAFNDVKSLNGRIFKDVNQILLDNSLESQKQFLTDELHTGTQNKDTVRKIANRIAEKTGDWSRDFDRIIEYASSSAHEIGKLEMLERSYGSDTLIWRRVYAEACKHCIRIYLTGGIGSEPKIFTIEQVRANGSNIGRKSADWLAVEGATHPYCRCSWNVTSKGSIWNSEKQVFEASKQLNPKRKPIRIEIGGKEMLI